MSKKYCPNSMTKRPGAFKLNPIMSTKTPLPHHHWPTPDPDEVLIGLDVGGTKIEICALGQGKTTLIQKEQALKQSNVKVDTQGRRPDLGTSHAPLELPAFLYRERLPTPQGDYEATLEVIRTLIKECTRALGIAWPKTVGLGLPGALDAQTQCVRGSNSLVLNGKPMALDLRQRLGTEVLIQNDANCFALSEAMDGAAKEHQTVFGVIIGTGCGGGIVHDHQIWSGANRLGGEWGHTPLPWSDERERARPKCWCGKSLCMERFVSGPGFEEDYLLATGESLKAPQIVSAARLGHGLAQETLSRYIDRLARGLSVVVNILDPDCIVLGGGMSLIEEIYVPLQSKLSSYSFYASSLTPIVKALHGDSSGVRGAAWLSRTPTPWGTFS